MPQNRERCFIIGHLRGRSTSKVFPIEGTDGDNSVSLNLFGLIDGKNSQKDRIHIVCNDFYDIFQDIGDLQILEPFITMGKITIHIIKQNFIIDKNSYNADMIKRVNIMFLTRYCYISTLSHNIRVAKNHKKSISKS